jgi:dephospho-CoA kinase
MGERGTTPTAARPMVVALTGGIASGKTAVSDRFARLGVPIIDTDRIARDVVAPGSEGLRAVRDEFGPKVLADGALDRSALRERIFNDVDARRRLEAILHPRIADAARDLVDEVDAPYAILVVPLLVESGLFDDVDRVLLVDVPEHVQIARVQARDGLSRRQAEATLAAQASRGERLARADDVITNTGSLEDLATEVGRLDAAYRDLAGTSSP